MVASIGKLPSSAHCCAVARTATPSPVPCLRLPPLQPLSMHLLPLQARQRFWTTSAAPMCRMARRAASRSRSEPPTSQHVRLFSSSNRRPRRAAISSRSSLEQPSPAQRRQRSLPAQTLILPCLPASSPPSCPCPCFAPLPAAAPFMLLQPRWRCAPRSCARGASST